MWAQRPKHIILSIQLTDVKDPVIKVEPTKLYFKGVGGTEMKEHEVEMEFFKKIDVEVIFFSYKLPGWGPIPPYFSNNAKGVVFFLCLNPSGVPNPVYI